MYLTSEDQVFKFYLQGSQLELLIGHYVPGVFPLVSIGECMSNESFEFKGDRAVPAGRLVAQMPFAARSLDKAMMTGGPDRAREIASCLFPQLMLLHLLGIAHNDIKPGNVLAREGGGWMLHDFGISVPWSA